MKKNINLVNDKFIYGIVFLYVYLIRKIAFPSNFQQDDISELKIDSFKNFSCILDQGDNHPVFSYTIWIIAKIFPSNTEYILSTLNIVLSVMTIFILYKLIYKLSNQFISLILVTIFISSEIFLVYSISLKQYSVETLGCVFLISVFFNYYQNGFSVLNDYKTLILSLIFCVTSLPLLVLFFLICCIIVIENRENIRLTYRQIIIFSPVLIFLPRIITKISRPEYKNYWNEFFIQTNSFLAFFDSAVNVFNLMMRNYFGILFIQQLGLIYLIVILIPIFLRDTISIKIFSILSFFIILNFMEFYPLGAGRTDLILFPLILILISRSITFMKINIKFLQISLIMIFACSIIYVNPYYKIESMTPILEDLSGVINSEDSLIVPMVEQKYPFEYYSKKLFGQKEQLDENNCHVYKPNIENYMIFDPELEKSNLKIASELSSSDFKEIYLIGIELPGTIGLIREAELLVEQFDYKVSYEKNYDIGMILLKFSK